jgi:hypothetical protein
MGRRSFPEIRREVPCSLILTVLASLLTLATPAQSQNPTPGILPPNSAPNGKTYGKWSAAWFKWAYERPQPIPGS